MNMNSMNNDQIKNQFADLFAPKSKKESLNRDAFILMNRFLSEIQKLADKKGLKRKELAALIGTSPSYLTQLFRGDKMANMETLAKFQQALDVKFNIETVSASEDLLSKAKQFHAPSGEVKKAVMNISFKKPALVDTNLYMNEAETKQIENKVA
jgi:transcriptional regulator with XRE-family HTH domain